MVGLANEMGVAGSDAVSLRQRLDRRIIAWAALFVFFGFYVTIGGTYPWLGLGSARVLTHLGFASLAVIWATLAWRRSGWVPEPSIAASAVAVVAVATVSAVASPVPRVAFEAVIAGSCLACAFLFLTCLARDPWFRPRLTQLIVLFAVLLVLAYAVENLIGWVRWYSVTHSLAFPLRPGGASLTFGAIAAVAALLLLVVPFAVVILWQAEAHRSALLLAFVALAELTITGSRAAYLGAIVSGAIAGTFWLRGRPGAARQNLLLVARRLLLIGVPLAALASLLFAGPLVARLFDANTIWERFSIWIAAERLIADRPIFGNGPGTWPVLSFARYPSGAPILVVSHAHNTFIQLAVDVGLVGISAIAAFLVIVGRFVRRATVSTDARLSHPAVAILMGVAGFATLSLVDHLVNIGAIVLVLAILAAWVIGGTASTQALTFPFPARQRRRSKWLAASLLVVLAAAAVPVAVTDRATFASESGNRALQRLDWSTATAAFTEAVELDPGFVFYSYELAAVQSFTGDAASARRSYQELAIVDRAPWVLLSLAYLELDAGDHAAALEHAGWALDRGYGDAEVALNVGAIAEGAGDAQLALDARAQAVAEAPAIAGSPYWASTATPAPVVAGAAEGLLRERGDPMSLVGAALVRIYGGDIAGGRDALHRLPASPDVDRALAVADFEDGQRDAAFEELRRLLDATPDDVLSLRLLARYSADTGDRDEAKRYIEWIDLIGGAYSGWAQFEPTGTKISTSRESLTSNFPPAYPWAVFLRLAPPLMTPPDYLVIVDSIQG